MKGESAEKKLRNKKNHTGIRVVGTLVTFILPCRNVQVGILHFWISGYVGSVIASSTVDVQ